MQTVSVVICCYTEDRWDDLTEAVASLAEQTHSPSEVLIVVDHNPRLERRAAAAFTAALDTSSAVRVLGNEGTAGLSGARNTGVRHAIGEIVAFLDDDAKADPLWLAEMLSPYADPDVAAVGGKAFPAWPDGEAPVRLPAELYWIVGCAYTGQPEELDEVRNLMGCAMSFRRELVALLGGFAEDIGRTAALPLGCEETELCIRLRQQFPHAKVVLQPRATVRHRVTEDRVGWRYLRRRSWSEGLSKAAISRMVGPRDALSTERSYLRSVIPRGFLRELRRGRTAALGGLLLATSAAGAGYLVGRTRRVKSDTLPSIVDEELAAQAQDRPPRKEILPRVSVVLATAGDVDAARRCVRSVLDTGYPDLEVLVVDNHPSRAHRDLRALAETDGRIRYVREPVPGASRARNRGAREATGEVLAFTDDDAVVDAQWLDELVAELGRPGTPCVTGLVEPLCLETQAQVWFEAFGGFGKGYLRRVFTSDSGHLLSPGKFGSGNNMAWLRKSFLDLGGFDERLGPGRHTRSGEDLDLFLRLVGSGARLTYTPHAVVWHEHRATEGELRRQLRGYGTGLAAMYLVHARRRGGLLELLSVFPQGLRVFFGSRSATSGPEYPRRLMVEELRGMLSAPAALLRESRR